VGDCVLVVRDCNCVVGGQTMSIRVTCDYNKCPEPEFGTPQPVYRVDALGSDTLEGASLWRTAKFFHWVCLVKWVGEQS
jgi:hypothetical protein